MERHDQDERSADAESTDEQPTGPAQPGDPYPQPVQEIVDPNDPDALEDRPRTAISGHREPRSGAEQ